MVVLPIGSEEISGWVVGERLGGLKAEVVTAVIDETGFAVAIFIRGFIASGVWRCREPRGGGVLALQPAVTAHSKEKDRNNNKRTCLRFKVFCGKPLEVRKDGRDAVHSLAG